MCVQQRHDTAIMSVRDYVETSEKLKKAYERIKYGQIQKRTGYEEQFAPILQPLEEIKEKLTYPKSHEPPPKSHEPPPTSDIPGFPLNFEVDKTFGIRMTEGNTMEFGTLPVKLGADSKGKTIAVGDTIYRLTTGLWRLMTAAKPTGYTPEDLTLYEEMVMRSHVYRRDNDPYSNWVKSSGGEKYKQLIRPMLIKNKILATRGKGLQKIVTNAPVEYVYWNSLDELLEKLYILYGEYRSGNTNPSVVNEIVNIIEEFKEL